MNNIEDVLKNDAFKMFSENEKQAFKKLLTELQGKSAAESMQSLMLFQSSLPKKKLSQAEQAAIMAAIMDTLSDADKTKFGSIFKMIEGMKR